MYRVQSTTKIIINVIWHFCFSNLSVPDEGYSRCVYASCALNLISTFLLL